MLRIALRLGSLFVAANGAFMLWVARYGALWQYPTDLGWFAPYVLRPGMFVIGAWALVLGLWYGGACATITGRVLAQWADDVAHDLHCGAVADLGWPTVLRSYSRELWDRRGCLIGRHAMEALNYFPDEGTVCEDCGLVVVLHLSWRDRLWLLLHREDKVQDKWSAIVDRACPPLEAGLAKLAQEERRIPDLLRAQAGRCAEAGLHDTAAELRTEADRLDGGLRHG